ncbi:heme-binding protein [Amycolatopsis sp. Hca4]|uniref:GlcG/HbpS family heme-binding protein n=1 Tax=Amycolatopsis sp. Hca4 TaxID=2742131 RepID=UPI001590E853|nr:heme-binding protein [Amycolatopsis sp. Hca4]QKV80615.1 heme-binding protein [Amycolatopsis sp. Hca4]
MTVKTESVSLEDARRVVAAGEAKAGEIGSPSNIAVVDAGGNLVAHIRMDEAWIGSVDISINKAFTSRAFDISTVDLAASAGPGEQFFGINASNNGRVMIFAGGIPLRHDGRVVGAVGVSGGSGEQDQTVAEAAAKAF